jgi:hypothetical protein
MWSLSLLYCDFARLRCTARFAENLLHLGEKIGGAIWLGENSNVFQFSAITQALVIEHSAHHQDPHLRTFSA